MAPHPLGLQCMANKAIVERLKECIQECNEKQKDKMALIYQKALHSVMTCTEPIRNKRDATRLKGVGDFIGDRIEGVLRREKLLNVPATPDELRAEVEPRSVKKTDVSKYVPRYGGPAHSVLLSIVMVSCETESDVVPLDALLPKLLRITAQPQTEAKARETLRLLQQRGLATVSPAGAGLTDMGRRLGLLCLEECRLQNPVVEHFMEGGKLAFLRDRVPALSEVVGEARETMETMETMETKESKESKESKGSKESKELRLPALHWPLRLEAGETGLGEEKEEKEEEEEEMQSNRGESVRQGESWETVLVLDNREVRSQEDRNFLENRLRSCGIDCEVRTLTLGDMLLIARSRDTNQEVVLNYIVERKNARDLAHSIQDGRFNEQQYRLQHCGCRHPFYLIEGTLKSQDVLPAESLQTAICTTMLTRGLHIYQSSSIDDTVVFLKGLYEQAKQVLSQYVENGDESCFHPEKLSFAIFQVRYQKPKGLKLSQLWAKQLRQVPRCTPSRIYSIIQKYPTLAHLQEAYRNLSTEKEREEMLKCLGDHSSASYVGPTISKYIYHVFHDTSYSS